MIDRLTQAARRGLWVGGLVFGLILPGFAAGQRQEPAPDALAEVGVDEHLDAQIPLDLRFRDENGRDLTLASLFQDQRPVILVLHYSDCPMLCALVLNGMVDGLQQLAWTPGKEFDVVSVSINPLETPQRARLTKQRYVRSYGRPETAGGWHFLTGSQASIERLTDAVGFRYKYIEADGEYAHAAVLIICTPQGRVSRYLYGVQFPEQTLRLSLVEAGEGRVGSTFDRVLLFCFHYDADAGRYGPVARNLMKRAAGMTCALLMLGMIPYWLWRRNPVPEHSASDGAESESGGLPPAVPPAPSVPVADSPADEVRAHPGFALPLVGLIGVPSGSLFFPQRATAEAAIVDQVFYFIFIVAVVFFALIVGLMVFFVFKYRRREGVGPEPSPSHSTSLELIWSIIPTILVAVMFVWGFWGYMSMRQAPEDSYEIQVLAKKWAWNFVYPNGHVEADLHVPMDQPIRLVMSSDDVIHSLFVPAFRLKMDVVPGRYTMTWFHATEPGEYQLYCAEYCGTQHSTMLAKVVVHPPGEFEKWLEDAASFLDRMTPVEAGALLVERRGCLQCHSLDGSAKVGPTFRGVFGTQQAMTTGEILTVDENYILESILEPMAKIRAGYRPVMPTYKGQLQDEEITAISAYIKSLKEGLQLAGHDVQGLRQPGLADVLRVVFHPVVRHRRSDGPVPGHVGDGRSPARHVFRRGALSLRDDGRHVGGVSGRSALLVAENVRTHDQRILGPARLSDHLRRFQHDVSAPVSDGHARDAAAVCPIPAGVSSPAPDFGPVDFTGLYWHLVDLIWIYLFPLLYLIH